MINKIKILAVGLITATTFSITNADLTIIQNGETYSPNTLTIEENTTISVSDIQSTCNYEGKCNMVLWKGDKVYTIEHFIEMGVWNFYTDESEENGGSNSFNLYLTPGTYTLSFDGGGEDEDYGAFESITFTNIGNTTQGGVGGDNEETQNGTIIQQGTAVFTPIINRLIEIAGEFIPYIISIALRTLGITLTWNAVKYILGYLKNKSKGTIKNERVYYNRKQHNIDEKNGKLKQEREYYKK